MSLLLLFQQEGSQDVPLLPQAEEPARAIFDAGGGIGRNKYAFRRRREEATEEDDVAAIMAAFLTTTRRH